MKLFRLLVTFCFLGLVLAGGLFVYIARDLPRPERFTEREFPQTTKIYDKTGEHLLYTVFGEEKRTAVSLSSISPLLQYAVVATEDADFYKHHGIQIRSIVRSVLLNVKTSSRRYGGSTISQQLIRSTFLAQEKTLTRKLREAILTLELERRYDKDQILEWYLNQVPFGNNAYGAEAASQTYFATSAQNIGLAQAALLAAVIQAPSYLSPYGNHIDELFARKDYVLQRMFEERYITKEEMETALATPLEFEESKTYLHAPHFTLYVKDLLEQEYGDEFLQEKGLKIYTTLDWDLQQKVEEFVAEQAKANEANRSYNVATVALQPATGEVVALVGSRDWHKDPVPENCIPGDTCLFESQYDVATSTPGRQPGSAFKPIVYATAFEKGYTDTTVVVDEPTNFGIWGGKPYAPENFDGRYRGAVTLRTALAGSLNVPAVKVLAYLAGVQDSIDLARDMGITTLTHPVSFYGLSLVLGGGEVRPLDMASAYSVFANDGARVSPTFIYKIEDAQGNLVKAPRSVTPKRIISSKTARLISNILSDNTARSFIFGTNSPLHVSEFDAAVKTGTTNDFKDAWAVGYTSSLVVAVWAGNNDNSPMVRGPGVSLAAPLWKRIILEGAARYLPTPFLEP